MVTLKSAYTRALTRLPASPVDLCRRGVVIQSWGRAGAMTKESRSALTERGLASAHLHKPMDLEPLVPAIIPIVCEPSAVYRLFVH